MVFRLSASATDGTYSMSMVGAIDVIESRADKITHETMALLHSTFITPLDREEIHKLISNMDDVLDTIQDTAQAITVYDVRKATPEAIRFAEIIRAACEKVSHAVGLLSSMDNGPAILAACQP